MKYGLFKNESIKIWRQTANRVIVIILAAIIVTIPVLLFLADVLLTTAFSYDTAERRYENALDYANDARYRDEGEGDTNAKIAVIYYETEAFAAKFFIDNKIAGSWKYEYYMEDLENLSEQVEAYRLLSEGLFSFDELLESDFRFPMLYYRYEGSRYAYDEGTGGYFEYDETGFGTLVDISHKAYHDYIKGLLNELKSFILSTDFSGHLKDYADSCRAQYTAAAGEVTLAESALVADPADEALKYNYDTALMKRGCLGEKARLADLLVSAGAEYNDWRYLTVTSLMNAALDDKASRVIMPLSLYSGVSDYYGGEYKDYVSAQEDGLDRANDALAVLDYSLEHDIPTPYVLEKSAKLSWQNGISSAVGYIRIFMMILAGTIVAGEFSSGSIRLLLIRPKKRWKILTAKLTSAAFWSFFLMIAAAAALFFLNIITNGVTDIFTPDLVAVGGTVLRIPAFITVLYTLILSALPAFLMFSFSFLISVLTHKSALAIALSLIANTLFSLASSISVMLMQSSLLERYFGFLAYTPLPYNDMTVFLGSPVGYYSANLDMGIGSLLAGGNASLYGSLGNLNALTGAAVLILNAALFVYFSYLSFTRQQIKS